MRQDKKKQKAQSEAARKHRSKKKVLKEEDEDNLGQDGSSLYDNLMRVVIYATHYPY